MLVRAAAAAYLAWSILLIAQQPGLQYDEALLAADAVQMLRSPGEITLPHDPHTWICPGRRCFPLMTVLYIGSIKAWLCLPLFKIFGAGATIIRTVSMLLAALGVWGFGALLADLAGALAGGAAALALAFNPTYVNMTVFDNSGIAAMMGALGLLCFAIRAYLRRPVMSQALGLGAAMGFGVWARANFLWLLLGLGVGTVLVLRGRLRNVPGKHAALALVGGVLAGSPFLLYQAVSGFGTWKGLNMFVEPSGLAQRVWVRLVLLAELFWTDREHRAMWGGAELGEWQRWLFLAVAVAACALATWKGPAPARIATWTFVVLAAIMLPSRMQVWEHHLILLLPVAIAVTALVHRAIPNRWVWGVLGAVYFLSAAYWQAATARGLAETGGIGFWSDAIYDVADYLSGNYPDRRIQVLDWGLNTSLFVLSQGRLKTTEVYDQQRDWRETVRQGGVFLTTTEDDRKFPEASAAFLAAVKELAPNAPRYLFQQTNGAGFAQLIDISPGR